MFFLIYFILYRLISNYLSHNLPSHHSWSVSRSIIFISSNIRQHAYFLDRRRDELVGWDLRWDEMVDRQSHIPSHNLPSSTIYHLFLSLFLIFFFRGVSSRVSNWRKKARWWDDSRWWEMIGWEMRLFNYFNTNLPSLSQLTIISFSFFFHLAIKRDYDTIVRVSPDFSNIASLGLMWDGWWDGRW